LPETEPVDTSRNASRVRDHLANERTYLAWIRTAVALMAFGVVLARLRFLVPAGAGVEAHGWELGLVFAAVGLLTVVLSTLHYFEVRRAIETAEYEPGSRWVILFSAAVGLIGVGVMYWLLAAPKGASSYGP
jgi:putative membrane protein